MTPVDEQKTPELASMLARYPDLARDTDAQVNLAVLEYEDLKLRGDAPSVMSFAARFPACRSRLAKLLVIRTQLERIGEPLSDASAEPAALPDLLWPEVGDRLLGFNLLGVLGAGAFSRVYLARESALGDRLVALKVSLEGKDVPAAAAEADILGRLSHPNIVPIHSVQTDPVTGFTVVCMPYLGSTTLSDVIEFVRASPEKAGRAWVILAAAADSERKADIGPLPEPSPALSEGAYIDGVIELGIQLADALAYVHERHIFHRDLKPSNVLIRPDGRPMLLDFNLSAVETNTVEAPLGGTLLYMSPEQLRATADTADPRPILLDARADVYSLGVLLYELLAGDHPFIPREAPERERDDDDLRGLLNLRQSLGPTPLRHRNRLADKHLSTVIEKCLAAEPNARFQTATDLTAALRQCRSPEHRLRRWLLGRTRWTWLTLAGLTLAAAAVFAVAAAVRLPARERHLQEGIQALQDRKYERAVDLLGRAIAEEDSFRGHMARARAFQKLGRFKDALADFKLADKLKASGHTKACVAYCYSKLETPEDHYAAAGFYLFAWNRGYQNAVVANNRGYSFHMSRRFSAFTAKDWFRKAIELDAGFQPAYYNLFKLELDSVRAGEERPKLTLAGLAALEKAFATGPSDGEMHYDAARFFLWFSKTPEALLTERALYHVKQAIKLGVRPAFSNTGDDAAFRTVLRNTPLGEAVSPVTRIQDPFLSIDE